MDAEAIHAITSTPPTTAAAGVSPIAAAMVHAPKNVHESAGGAAATALISTPGQFYSELQALAQNPAQFKSLAAQVARLFENAASKASGSEAQVLADLASRFSLAAQTGVLPPPGGAQASPANPAPAASARSVHASTPAHFYDRGAGSGLQAEVVQMTFASALRLLNQTSAALDGPSATTNHP
jgi:hypothetical protein